MTQRAATDVASAPEPDGVDIAVKRVYDATQADDGQRVLVDRVWPRGVSKARAELDEWLPEVAPSTALRQWFGHDPARWDEFCRRYWCELDENPAIAGIEEMLPRGRVTLLYSARSSEQNQAVALAAWLRTRMGEPAREQTRRSDVDRS